MRGAIHYIFTVVVLIIYGGQVCPFLGSLDMRSWTILLFLFFGGTYLIRAIFLPSHIENSPPEKRVRRTFWGEWLFFIGVSILITFYNFYVYDFPIGSGLKIVLGSLGLGFFAATDMALAKEREIYDAFSKSGDDMPLADQFMTLTGKFTLIASLTLLFVGGVVVLVVTRDMVWLIKVDEADLMGAYISIAIEMVFIAAVTLADLINLILSFSRNLKIFFAGQNDTLMAATSGDLDSKVTVSAVNEFGVMGHYTNKMIGSLRRRTNELQVTQDVTIMSLASLAETRDNETGAHILRTQRYVQVLVHHLKGKGAYTDILDEETCELIYKSAPLHDIGKVGIPDAILLKPGKLTEGEFDVMKKHAQYGQDALLAAEQELGTNSFLRFAGEIACSHHEKWDGSGYPLGLKGDDIPLSGRLMALADVYDALITERVYKPAFTHEKAIEIISEGRGAHFDPEITDAFCETEREFADIAKKHSDHLSEVAKVG